MGWIKSKFGYVDMTEGTPWKKLMIFTVPLLVGNIFQQFYSVADAMILGRFVGINALAAVGASMPVFFLIMVLMMGIAVGAGIMVSQYFGAKSRSDLSYTIGNAITLTAILGAILMAFGPLLSRPLMELLNTPPEIIDDSVVYMNILLWGVLGMAYFNMLSGILRGLGDAFSPLLYLAISSILNIGLNYLFVVGFGWGMPAVAAGTVLAQGLCSLLCLRKMLKMRDTFAMGMEYLKPKKFYKTKILKLGIPTGASQAIIAVAAMVVQPLVNSFGPAFIGAMTIVMRIDGFVIMPIFSFGNGATVYAGQNMGAGKKERINQGTKQAVFMSIVVSLILIGGILIFGRFVAGAFADPLDPNTPYIIDLSQRMLIILAPGYLALSVAMVLWGSIRGAGDAMSPLWASIINTVVIRVPTAFLFVWLLAAPDWANPEILNVEAGNPDALMFSLLAAWTTNMVLAIIVYRIGKWRTKGIETKEQAKDK